jgi:hypothetical protein
VVRQALRNRKDVCIRITAFAETLQTKNAHVPGKGLPKTAGLIRVFTLFGTKPRHTYPLCSFPHALDLFGVSKTSKIDVSLPPLNNYSSLWQLWAKYCIFRFGKSVNIYQ